MTVYDRTRKLVSALAETGADTLLVSKPPNVRYLTDFSGEGLVVLSQDGDAALSTDGRYRLTAEQECPDCALVLNENGHLMGAIGQVKETGCKRLAFESEGLTYAQYQRLTEGLDDVELLPTTGLIEKLRAIKDNAEVAKVQQAAAIADQALTDLLPSLEPGPTEQEVALDLERAILLAGAEAIAFQTILAAGPSAAWPHAIPGQRKLQAGQMVKIDVGARVGGYCSDMTRTVFLGEPDEKFYKIYQLVFDAQVAALKAVKPGLECKELDRIAREVIADAGYGENFSHGLGHGVGLEVHEAPRIGKRSDAVLQTGMVITVEPGIYIENWGGVRIEDLVLVTEEGARVLTNAPKLSFSA